MNPIGMVIGIGGALLAGYIFLWAGKEGFKFRLSCTEEIQAKFLGIKRVSNTRDFNIKGEFEFYYCGKKRVFYTLENFGFKLEKQFKEGETYTIYVNPANPEIFRCTRKIFHLGEFIYIIWGGCMFYGGMIIVIIETIKLILGYI